MELIPSQMAALRVFVGLASRLRVPPADGLAEQVRAAWCDHGIKRWRLYLTQEQMGSVAYGLWLHRMTGSAAEANRFGREYGVVHSPVRASDEDLRPSTDCRRRPERTRGVVRGSAGEGDRDRLVGADTEGLGERGVFGGVDGQAPPGLVGAPIGRVRAAVALGVRLPGQRLQHDGDAKRSEWSSSIEAKEKFTAARIGGAGSPPGCGAGAGLRQGRPTPSLRGSGQELLAVGEPVQEVPVPERAPARRRADDRKLASRVSQARATSLALAAAAMFASSAIPASASWPTFNGRTQMSPATLPRTRHHQRARHRTPRPARRRGRVSLEPHVGRERARRGGECQHETHYVVVHSGVFPSFQAAA